MVLKPVYYYKTSFKILPQLQNSSQMIIQFFIVTRRTQLETIMEHIEELKSIQVKDQRILEMHMGSKSTLHRRLCIGKIWLMIFNKLHLSVVCEDSPAQWKEKHLAQAKQPWSKVGIDLYRCRGKDHLIIIDCLTNIFLEIAELQQTGATEQTSATMVILAIKQQFARMGSQSSYRQMEAHSLHHLKSANLQSCGAFNIQFHRHTTDSPQKCKRDIQKKCRPILCFAKMVKQPNSGDRF